MNGATARIILRYGVGALAGWGVGEQLAADPDVQKVVTAGVTISGWAIIEVWYWFAKKNGLST